MSYETGTQSRYYFEMWSILKLLIASDSGQNVRLINDILEQAELQSVSGILLELDFRKAFDTIE